MVETLAGMGEMSLLQAVSSSVSWAMKYSQAEPAQSSAHSGPENDSRSIRWKGFQQVFSTELVLDVADHQWVNFWV